MLCSHFDHRLQDRGAEDRPSEVPANTSHSGKQADSGPWYLTLVNRWNPLPENYDLELAEVEGGELVDQRIYDPLMEMLEAAEAEGLGPIVVSGYRTRAVQQRFMDEKNRGIPPGGLFKEGC